MKQMQKLLAFVWNLVWNTQVLYYVRVTPKFFISFTLLCYYVIIY